eukprot:scaffold10615_cov106-Isochrysis_galbana.AAC.7
MLAASLAASHPRAPLPAATPSPREPPPAISAPPAVFPPPVVSRLAVDSVDTMRRGGSGPSPPASFARAPASAVAAESPARCIPLHMARGDASAAPPIALPCDSPAANVRDGGAARRSVGRPCRVLRPDGSVDGRGDGCLPPSVYGRGDATAKTTVVYGWHDQGADEVRGP